LQAHTKAQFLRMNQILIFILATLASGNLIAQHCPVPTNPKVNVSNLDEKFGFKKFRFGTPKHPNLTSYVEGVTPDRLGYKISTELDPEFLKTAYNHTIQSIYFNFDDNDKLCEVNIIYNDADFNASVESSQSFQDSLFKEYCSIVSYLGMPQQKNYEREAYHFSWIGTKVEMKYSVLNVGGFEAGRWKKTLVIKQIDNKAKMDDY